jgi:hypothetical protein
MCWRGECARVDHPRIGRKGASLISGTVNLISGIATERTAPRESAIAGTEIHDAIDLLTTLGDELPNQRDDIGWRIHLTAIQVKIRCCWSTE